jgi:hypothetical protein
VIGGTFARAGWNADDIGHTVDTAARFALDNEWKDRARTAKGAVEVKANGRAVPGLQRCRDVWGEAVATTLGKWLNMRADPADRLSDWTPQPGPTQPNSQIPSPPLTAEALSTMTFEPIKYVVPGVIVEGLTLLAGKPKVGISNRCGARRLYSWRDSLPRRRRSPLRARRQFAPPAIAHDEAAWYAAVAEAAFVSNRDATL